MVAPRHLTKTEIALQVLRERLRSGELAPGSRLRVEELAYVETFDRPLTG